MEPSQGVATELKNVRYALCHSHGEFRACQAIEQAVWNDPGLEVPVTLYVVAAETGGQVIGAFAGERMIGFTLALAGVRDRRPYLHSHMTAVLPEARDLGIGRGLKLFQRTEALARGIDRVEWTFDPLEIKNAYFNLMRLGVVVRRFLPNCYGITASPLHGGLPTDRLVAEWDLRAGRVECCLRGEATIEAPVARAERIPVPRTIDDLRQSDPAAARQIQTGIRERFQHWLGRGYVVVALETAEEAAQYVLEPGEAG